MYLVPVGNKQLCWSQDFYLEIVVSTLFQCYTVVDGFGAKYPYLLGTVPFDCNLKSPARESLDQRLLND
jgi:hypothetical protein